MSETKDPVKTATGETTKTLLWMALGAAIGAAVGATVAAYFGWTIELAMLVAGVAGAFLLAKWKTPQTVAHGAVMAGIGLLAAKYVAPWIQALLAKVGIGGEPQDDGNDPMFAGLVA